MFAADYLLLDFVYLVLPATCYLLLATDFFLLATYYLLSVLEFVWAMLVFGFYFFCGWWVGVEFEVNANSAQLSWSWG